MKSAKVIRPDFSELSRSAASNYIDKLRREISLPLLCEGQAGDLRRIVRPAVRYAQASWKIVCQSHQDPGHQQELDYYTERLVPNETTKADGRIRYLVRAWVKEVVPDRRCGGNEQEETISDV